MAINFPEGTASYSFKSPQQYAMHLRLTPEVKEALLKSQQNGKTASLRLTGTGLDNAIIVGRQSFELHPPAAQERLDVFTQSRQGCVQVGQIHQKAVIKRLALQAVNKHSVPSQHHQLQQGSHQMPHRLSAGPAQNGRTQQPSVQAVKRQHQAAAQPQALQRPSGQPRTALAPPPNPRGPHAAAAAANGLSKQTPASRQLPAAKQPPMKPPPPASGSHPSSASHPGQVAHPSQLAPAGVSNQSAQTAVPPKAPKAKATKAAGTSSVQAQEVYEQVFAAARKGHKEAMLVALLQCKPPKSQVMEVVFKEAEKKVAGFQRLQGDSYKRACSRYAEMKPGNKWALRQQFHQEALDILAAITSSSSPKERQTPLAQPSAAPAVALRQGSAEQEAARPKKKSAEPQAAPQRLPTPEPQGMDWGAPGSQGIHAVDKAKKKKRLTKAADMEKGIPSVQVAKASGTGLKRKLQTDSESGEDGAADNRGRKAHKGPSGLRPPTHNSAHPATTAAFSAPQPQQHTAGLDGYSHQHHHSQGQQWQTEDRARGNRGVSPGMQEHREGSVGAAGRSPGMEPPVTDGDGRQAAAAAPSVGKITLKIRRPGSDGYDESWFAEHVDRQPTLREPVASLDQWEEYVQEYNCKHALYFRLHREMQGTQIQVKGLQQAIHNAPSDSEKAKYKQQFELMWKRHNPRSQKWDKAWRVLHKELEALHKHLQDFHDQHAGL